MIGLNFCHSQKQSRMNTLDNNSQIKILDIIFWRVQSVAVDNFLQNPPALSCYFCTSLGKQDGLENQPNNKSHKNEKSLNKMYELVLTTTLLPEKPHVSGHSVSFLPVKHRWHCRPFSDLNPFPQSPEFKDIQIRKLPDNLIE